MACCLSEGNLKCTQKLLKAACSFDLKLAGMQNSSLREFMIVHFWNGAKEQDLFLQAVPKISRDAFSSRL